MANCLRVLFAVSVLWLLVCIGRMVNINFHTINRIEAKLDAPAQSE